MKHSKYLTPVFVAGIIIFSCNKSFLDVPLTGGLDESAIANRKGVENLLVGAYAMLDGVSGANQKWEKGGSASNWVFGSICGSEAYKGTRPGNQPDIEPLEVFTPTSNNIFVLQKWNALFTGIHRSNDVLRIMKMATDISLQDQKRIAGEARFLRAYYHFEAKKIWNKAPFVDETISYANNNYKLSNEKNIWPDIEDDLIYAVDSLPETQQQIGRANKYAALALLAKTYIYQGKFVKAKPLLDIIITSGKYQLKDKFGDNFNAKNKNSSESIFAVQTSVNDGAQGLNGNYGDALNFSQGGPGEGCCGFFQPSQYLVNHFKTDAVTGLPDLDHFNDQDVTSDQGIESSDPSFVPYSGTLDPRLDWTLGRRGIPFLDWGIHPGKLWIENQDYGGPYSPKKNAYDKSEEGIYTDATAWPVGTTNNVNLIRYADILLLASEVEIESDNLDKAREYVNMIRTRAENPAGFVKKYNDDSDPTKGFSNIPAARYFIKPYSDPWQDKDYARKAVRFERMLELGLEGHRFFDLVRWGIADKEINEYLQTEKRLRSYMANAHFTPRRNEYYPIPQIEIDKSAGSDGIPKLKQNPGYN